MQLTSMVNLLMNILEGADTTSHLEQYIPSSPLHCLVSRTIVKENIPYLHYTHHQLLLFMTLIVVCTLARANFYE